MKAKIKPKITYKQNLLGEDDNRIYRISIWMRTSTKTAPTISRHSSEKICDVKHEDEKKCKRNASLILRGLKKLK